MKVNCSNDIDLNSRKKLIINISILIMIFFCLCFILDILLSKSNSNYIDLTINFIKFFNTFLSFIAFITLSILYTRYSDDTIFIISLMYLSLAIGISMGHIDYFSFYNSKFRISNYIIVSASLLRISILHISISNSYKFKNIITQNKFKSIFFVIILTLILGFIENIFIKEKYYTTIFFIVYNIFLLINYIIISLKLYKVSIKKNECIYLFLSCSIFMLSIKAIYAIYGMNIVMLDIKLTSVFITYICFFIIIIGVNVELYLNIMYYKISNNNLKKFYTFVESNKFSYMFICNEKLDIFYINHKIKEYYKGNIDNLKFKEELLKNRYLNESLTSMLKEIEQKNSWRGVIHDYENDEILDCSLQVLDNDNKGNKEILVSYVDISKYIKLETELEIRRLNDIKKGEFISNISHELKTPLNIFYSTIQLLDKLSLNNKVNFKETYSKYNNSLRLNCKRMLRLVNNIVDTSRLDLGVFKPDYGNYDIVSIVEDVSLSTNTFSNSKNIDIKFDTNLEEFYIKCDPKMIERILLNIISNAIKYSNNNSSIYIYLLIENKFTKIFIIDEGIGIEDEIKAKIFERFIKSDVSFTRLTEGCGIGLSLVKSMVEIHGGEILVESILGKGSTFEIRLPNVLIENIPPSQYYNSNSNTEVELSDIYEIKF